MATPSDDAGRTCPACGYNLTGLGGSACPECGVTGAEGRRRAVERERRTAFDVAMSILVPPGIVLMGSLMAMRVMALGGGWWWVGLAIVAALFGSMAANDFRVAWRWAGDPERPGAPRTRRVVVATWFGLCFLGMQGVMIAALGGCLGAWGR